MLSKMLIWVSKKDKKLLYVESFFCFRRINLYKCVIRSGSGKTTILNALFRLYEKENGGIYLKGVEQGNMNL